MPNIRANIKSNTDKALTPFTYVLDSISLTNHQGQKADIQNIVTDFTITESLYTAAMIIHLNVKDMANFIEEYQLIGQETIEVDMGRHEFTSQNRINVKLKFYVTEYSMYGRGNQANTQAYTIVGVTKHAYISPFKRISRAVNDAVSVIIRRILTNDLLIDAENISRMEFTTGRFNGVLPLMNPLDTCYWLLRRAFDPNSRPFFLYESMIDRIRMESLTSLIDDKKNPIYRTYRDAKIYSKSPGTAEYYKELAERIINISSDFKLSKVLPTVSNGAYAANNLFLDLSTKTIKKQSFSYASIDPESTLNKHSVLSKKFGVPYENTAHVLRIDQTYDAFTEYLPINSLAYAKLQPYLSSTASSQPIVNYSLKDTSSSSTYAGQDVVASLNPAAAAAASALASQFSGWISNQFAQCILNITAGTGAGSSAIIRSNDANTLYWDSPCFVVDSSSKYTILCPDTSSKTYHDLMVNRLGTFNSVTETLDTFAHELVIAGDFNMRPGRKITLEIPKAIDLKAFDKKTMKGNFDDTFDRIISGNYLVTSVIHQFNEEYHCRIRVKRYSLTYDLNES